MPLAQTTMPQCTQDSGMSSIARVSPDSKGEVNKGWEGALPRLTIDGGKDDSRMVVGNDICVAVFGLVHLQVGILPCELLSRVNGLPGTEKAGGVRSEPRDTHLPRWETLPSRLCLHPVFPLKAALALHQWCW